MPNANATRAARAAPSTKAQRRSPATAAVAAGLMQLIVFVLVVGIGVRADVVNLTTEEYTLHLTPVSYVDGQMLVGPMVTVYAVVGDTTILFTCDDMEPMETFVQNVTETEAWGYVPCDHAATIHIVKNSAGKMVIN